MEAKDDILQLSDVSKEFESERRVLPVLSNIDLTVRSGEIVCLVGRSGVGKTTLLNIVAGLVPATTGKVKKLGPLKDHALPFVFQENALFPWMLAAENVALPLLVEGRPRHEALSQSTELLAQLDLSAIGDAFPLKLSGGMAKRVEVARALIVGAPLVLFDEPFAGLDYFRRFELRRWLSARLRQFNAAALVVTHDVEDAVALADRVVVLAGEPATVVDTIETAAVNPSEKADQSIVDRILGAIGHD